ncbi:hypothetical protein Ddye_002126 [Dipteronia dyeriana]|uniref:Rapid ALkalinization Factor n=1 Tax=Dipteronia dyeriana TaxID=168575 RepID=A0AAE0CU57_9ROSI|nr:hypothetical protein Ddye_002126 [Dipteronia dyeriana]
MACTLFVIDTEATNIGYGAIGRNGIPCGPNNKGNCKEGPPANNYQRGCENIEHCRSKKRAKVTKVIKTYSFRRASMIKISLIVCNKPCSEFQRLICSKDMGRSKFR